mgnify:CR=1 FL=1
MRPPHFVFRALADVLDLGTEAAVAVGLLTMRTLTSPTTGSGVQRTASTMAHDADAGSVLVALRPAS